MSNDGFKDSAHKFMYYYTLAVAEQRRNEAAGRMSGGNWDFSHPEAGDPRTWLCFGAIIGAIFGPLYYNQHSLIYGMVAGAAALGPPMMIFAFIMRKTTMMIGAMIKALRMALGFLNVKALGVPGMAWRGAKWGTGLGIITMLAQDAGANEATPVITGATVGILAGAGFQGIKLIASRLRSSN